jgi:hypothetical protein
MSVVQYRHMDRPDDQSKAPEQPQAQQPEGGWQYKPADKAADSNRPIFAGGTEQAPPPPQPGAEVEWTASEFVAHDKTPGWYAMLILAALGIGGGIFIWTRDIFSTLMVFVVAGIFAVAASRKPRVLTYRLDDHGVSAGNRFRPYSDFKSFAYQEEGPFASILFIPMTRFGLPFSVYMAPEDEQRVFDVLSQHLPLERGQLDTIDRFMKRVRF